MRGDRVEGRDRLGQHRTGIQQVGGHTDRLGRIVGSHDLEATLLLGKRPACRLHRDHCDRLPGGESHRGGQRHAGILGDQGEDIAERGIARSGQCQRRALTACEGIGAECSGNRSVGRGSRRGNLGGDQQAEADIGRRIGSGHHEGSHCRGEAPRLLIIGSPHHDDRSGRRCRGTGRPVPEPLTESGIHPGIRPRSSRKRGHGACFRSAGILGRDVAAGQHGLPLPLGRQRVGPVAAEASLPRGEGLRTVPGHGDHWLGLLPREDGKGPACVGNAGIVAQREERLTILDSWIPGNDPAIGNTEVAIGLLAVQEDCEVLIVDRGKLQTIGG